ncbi:MAG TPA: sensor histidine kinase [Actinomycetota bacterium]
MKRLRFRNLPLFGKFLLPFLGLVVVLGSVGTFLVVRDLSHRAESQIDDTLSRLSLDNRSLLRDRELYLLESANFSANLAGLAEAAKKEDSVDATKLLRSVIALKKNLDLLVVATPDGDTFLSFAPRTNGSDPVSSRVDWANNAFVQSALADAAGVKFAGLVTVDGRSILAVAGAVCSASDRCAPTGVAIVGMDVRQLIEPLGRSVGGLGGAIDLYDADGKLLTSSGGAIDSRAPALPASGLLRRTVAGNASLYAHWEVQGRTIGTVAVAVPTGPAFASVRGAALKLALFVLAGMVGIVGLGALVSRLTTKQVRTLLDTNRALGRGELQARAPVLGNDELGELARGVNQMAEELEASRETLELRVRQRTEEVERLLRERNEIFASLSHELRTPLATILRQSEMILDPTLRKGGKWNNETGSTIRNSAQQLLSLVNDILELARAEASKIDVNLEIVDPHDLLIELRPTIQGLARSGDLKLTLEMPPSLPRIRADRRRLREVLLNLVDNAVKYTPTGGSVRVSAAAESEGLRISVIDTGVGIPKEAGDRIFEPFYRVRGTKTQRGQASSGLGLALSKRLVEVQGGHIGFSSEPGEGSSFVVTMPSVPERKNGKAAMPRERELVGRRSR